MQATTAGDAEASTRVGRDADRDVIRGRRLDFSQKFLPDGLSLAPRLRLPHEAEARLVNQIQARSYLELFGLVERSIGARMAELRRGPRVADPASPEAPARRTNVEPGHRAVFGRLEAMLAAGMPAGGACGPRPGDVASFVLGKSAWGVLGIACQLGLLAQARCRRGVEPDAAMSPLFRDVLSCHWREASQHAILDELEWRREHAKLAPARRDEGVDDLIALVAGIDGLVRFQASADAACFAAACGRRLTGEERARVESHLVAAYRWQHVVSGAQEPSFIEVLQDLLTAAQMQRIGRALAPLVESTRWPS